jgi:hypothetical protein
MDPIEVVTLARFNLRIAQENLAAVRKNWFWPQMVRICEQKVLAAIDLLWAAQEAAGLN